MQTETKVAPAATDRKILSPTPKPESNPSRKAAELPSAKTPPTPSNPQLATSEPTPNKTTAPVVEARSDAALAPQATKPAPSPAWSTEDESAFQAMLARRKAAAYQRRGRDVGAQMLRPGEIAPNTGTVVAAIVGLVAERGTVSRGDLLAAMAKATFPHVKALPGDRGWCQGYVAGALRDGFLAVAGEPSPGNKSEEASR